MARLNGFLPAVVEALGKRNGSRCSFPNCTATTFGPSSESPMSISNTGIAAHIVAAGVKGSARRVDLNMTNAEKSSVDNGIYMCQTHGKLIDDDETEYTIEILRAWKEIAVKKAQLRQSLGISEILPAQLQGLPLAPGLYTFDTSSQINDVVDTAISGGCIGDLWGRSVAHAITDFLIEHIKNSFLHGGATSVELSISLTHLEVTDNGTEFAISNLVGNRGGAKALVELRAHDHARVAVSSSRLNDRNNIRIRYLWKSSDVSELTPCSAKLTVQDLIDFQQSAFTSAVNPHNSTFSFAPNIAVDSSCDLIYLAIQNYVSYSEDGMLQTFVNQFPNKNIVLVFDRLSEGVKKFFQLKMPDIKILVINPDKNDFA